MLNVYEHYKLHDKDAWFFLKIAFELLLEFPCFFLYEFCEKTQFENLHSLHFCWEFEINYCEFMDVVLDFYASNANIGEIFQHLDSSIIQGKMLTVTVVRMSPDLSVAKIYLSVFPSEKREEYLVHLKKYTKVIRNELGQRVKMQLRIVPELVFFIDDSLDYAAKIDELLK